MSLPTTSKPSQMSIRSFFQAKTPKYAPPPSQSQNSSNNNSNDITLDAPPIPLSSVPTTSTSQPQSQSQSQSYPPSEATPHPPPPSPGSNPNLPREAVIRAITPADVNALRRLNSLLLPVSYPEVFYNRAADPVTGRFSRVITWSHDGGEPKPIGGIVCRVEPDIDVRAPDGGPWVPQNLYIQSLCLLSPYRSMGLISAALDNVIAAVVTDPASDVRTVTAHVWTENEEGLHWYKARGFEKQEPAIKGYYLKLRPDSAWLVSKRVGASVLNALPSSTPPISRPDITSTTAAIMSLPPMTSQIPSPAAATPPAAVSNGAPSSTPPPATRPPVRVASGQSFQNQRAETEWNDLPADMAPTLLGPPKNASEPGSGASSRSSSTVRRKRDRSYPAAAFGQ